MPDPDPLRTTPWADDVPDAEPLDAGAPGPARYELGDEIARGGMGGVVRARDRNLNRELAVKLVHPHLLDRPAILRRFREEAEVLGRLQHPGVVPVHEVGTLPDGRPFFAMKLVAGRTLAAILASLASRERERPENAPVAHAPGSPELLQIFEQVCQTVAFAHSRGVVHRDLKPANVMVGEFGEVQVMDWGLARLANRDREGAGGGQPHPLPHGRGSPEHADPDATAAHADPPTGEDHTTPGQAVGTPAYMPPEQAIGEPVDERADVFALGGILGEILTGRPPFVGTRDAVLDAARAGRLEPAWDRIRASGADPELIDLAVRCLDPDPAGRPADAGEVAALVAAYRSVEDRLRAAERDRAAADAEAREQRKRRKVQLALAAALGLLLAAGGAFAWWRDKQAEEKRAAGLRQQVEDERRAADERDRLVRNGEAVTALLNQCEGALKADDADTAALALGAAEKRASEGGTGHLAGRLDRCRADLAVLRSLDRVDDFRWASAGGRFPRLKDIAARWRAAFADFAVRPGVTPSAEAAEQLAASVIRERLLAALDLWLIHEPSPELAALLQAADPDPYRDAVRGALVSRDGGRVQELARAEAAIDQPARFAVALEFLQPVASDDRRRRVLETALRRRPGDLSVLMTLGSSYAVNRKEGARERVRWFQAAVSAHPRSAGAWSELGVALRDTGDVDGAIPCYREAIRLNPELAMAHNGLGTALADKGDRGRAREHYEEAIRLSPELAMPHNNLGTVLAEQGEVEKAIASFREAIRLDPGLSMAHCNLGKVLAQTKRDLGEAAACFREAIRLDPTDARAHFGLGLVRAGKLDLDGAIESLRESVRHDPTFPPAKDALNLVLNFKAQMDAKGPQVAPMPREK